MQGTHSEPPPRRLAILGTGASGQIPMNSQAAADRGATVETCDMRTGNSDETIDHGPHTSFGEGEAVRPGLRKAITQYTLLTKT